MLITGVRRPCSGQAAASRSGRGARRFR